MLLAFGEAGRGLPGVEPSQGEEQLALEGALLARLPALAEGSEHTLVQDVLGAALVRAC